MIFLARKWAVNINRSLLTEKQAPQREEAHRVFIRATDSTQDLRTGMQGQIPGQAKRLKEGQANYETKTCAVYPLKHRIHLCWGLLALLRVGLLCQDRTHGSVIIDQILQHRTHAALPGWNNNHGVLFPYSIWPESPRLPNTLLPLQRLLCSRLALEKKHQMCMHKNVLR